jgi:hypothetical protein
MTYIDYVASKISQKKVNWAKNENDTQTKGHVEFPPGSA